MDPKYELKQFIESVYNDLDFIIMEYIPNRLDEMEMPQELYEVLVEAWREAKGRLPLDAVKKEIEIAEDKFLELHGLTGNQLVWKLNVYNMIRSLFKKNPVKRLLSKLLQAIDGIIDSLSLVVPSVSALKEIKENLFTFLI